MPARLTRRALLRAGAGAAGGVGLSLLGSAFSAPARAASGADLLGPLLPPDANGLMLPPGFSSRVIGRTGEPVAGTSYVWHPAPDGGATFATPDGGWIYVSNSEVGSGGGGVGAVRFDRDGGITGAYAILQGSSANCAGGPTPWGTWLSCEETRDGRVWECDPFTPGSQGVLRPALGVFKHEAAAVDPEVGALYLTEDEPDGLLYRFRPDPYPDLSQGTLEAAEVLGDGFFWSGQVRSLAWHPVPNPTPAAGGVQDPDHLPVEERATRYQLPAATPFERGEGCAYHAGRVFFATSQDVKIWRVDTRRDLIVAVYDRWTAEDPGILQGVDGLFVAPNGDVYAAEDGYDLEVVALTRSGDVKPLVRVTGQTGTEITGPALGPDGTRLYFSSQRDPGTTYEVTGPFLAGLPATGRFGRGALAAALAAAYLWSSRPGTDRLRIGPRS